MKQLRYVEDYLEELAGFSNKSEYSLARYDINVVDHLAITTHVGKPLTDKQGALAIKIVNTYRRQMAKNDVNVLPLDNPVFRLSLVHPDRTRSVSVINDKIIIKFPYNNKLVDATKEFSRTECYGRYRPDTKTWDFPITETVINWVVVWGRMHQFTVASKILDWFEQILKIEAIPYKIQLVETEDALTIENAHPDLLQYISDKDIALTYSYINELVRWSGPLGFKISDECLAHADSSLRPFASVHSSHITNSVDNLSHVGAFAKTTNLYPIYIYDPIGELSEPGTPILSDEVLAVLGVMPDEVQHIKGNSKILDTSTKLVYATMIPRNWNETIPILISTVEMMHNGNRQRWRMLAERIVYYTATIAYNKEL